MPSLTPRENLLSLYRRKGYEYAPVQFSLCASQIQRFMQETGSDDYAAYFNFPFRYAKGLSVRRHDEKEYYKYYGDIKIGTVINHFGVAHEKGSDAAFHMTRMLHPLCRAVSPDDIVNYEFPEYYADAVINYRGQIEQIHKMGLAAVGSLECSVWETSWYIRGMTELMMDMMDGSEMAELLLDKITNLACARIRHFAECGADLIRLGDDIGMQNSIMISVDLYREWLKPRHKKVIDTAKSINPDILIQYHSCGYIAPFIDDLIEVGIDILNPVQPECMDFGEIHAKYGRVLSFNGTLGTQTTMPFGTPDDVRGVVFKNLSIAGAAGGLVCCPTHLIEPEVPWENIVAYVDACEAYKI